MLSNNIQIYFEHTNEQNIKYFSGINMMNRNLTWKNLREAFEKHLKHKVLNMTYNGEFFDDETILHTIEDYVMDKVLVQTI